MGHYFREAIHWIEHMNRLHWVIVLTVAALVGILFMRGFGSRSGY
jgi:hypothetical protein